MISPAARSHRMKRPRGWDRSLWGIVFLRSMPEDPDILIGQAWHSVVGPKRYDGEPSRTLIFDTRRQARAWVKSRPVGWWERGRFRVVRVRETVTVKVGE